MSPEEKKLAELRGVLFAASQACWTISAVLKDREMPTTASSVSDLAEMLSNYSEEPSAKDAA